MHNGYGKYVLYAVREGQAADALCLLFECGFQAENLYGIEILPFPIYYVVSLIMFFTEPQAHGGRGMSPANGWMCG